MVRSATIFRVAATLVITLCTIIGAQPLFALSGSDWRAGRIIDDAIFYNKSSMTIDQIQQFLNAKVPTCDTWGTQSYGGTTRRAYSEARGVTFPLTCLKDYQENTSTKQNNLEGRPVPSGAKSAANILWDAAQEFNINPQVLITMLQKEQALVLDDWPWPIQYRSALGYGCPDTAACDSQYYGFYNQVQNAARQFRRYANFPNDYNHIAGRNNAVRFSPNSSCGSSTVYIENTATASLYNYTPYQPNQSALNNLYGSGDSCGAYGNRNFWRDFNNWFGVSFGDGFVLAKSDDPNDLRQWVLYGTIKQYVPDSQTKLAWNLGGVDLMTMSAATLDSIATGPPLDRLARYSGSAIYFIDGGKRYKMPWDALLDVWNLRGRTISSVSLGLFNQTADAGEMSFSVKAPTSNDIYMPEGSSGNGQTVLRPFANSAVHQAWEGTTRVTEVSADFWDSINNAIGATLTSTKISYGGSEYEVAGTYRLGLTDKTASLYPATAQPVSAVTANRLIPAGNATHLIRQAGGQVTFVLDRGSRHRIANSDIFAAWTSGARVNVMNEAFVNLIPEGDPVGSLVVGSGSSKYFMQAGQKIKLQNGLDEAFSNALSSFSASTELMESFPAGTGVTGFIQGSTSPQVYLLDNSGKRRHLEWVDKVVSWGGYRDGITVLPQALVDSIQVAASPQLYVSDGVTNYVMDDGKKYSVTDQARSAWGFGAAQVFSDTTLARFESAGNLPTEFNLGSSYFIIRGTVSYGTSDRSIAEAWNIQNSQRMSQGVFAMLRNFMLTRYVRSSAPGDDRVFLVDNGKWYNLPPAHQANLRVSSQPVMTLDPSGVANIMNWQSAIFRSNANGYYVVDNGGRRMFAHQAIQDHWTNFGQISTLTLSNGFINSLPNRGNLERSIKGSDAAVYSAEAAAKRHIESNDTFTSKYAPYVIVSDELINALPTGQPIN